MEINWFEILETIIYGLVGITLMFSSLSLFDMLVPYDFNKELKEKNEAAGYVIAGIFIAVAIIVRQVII